MPESYGGKSPRRLAAVAAIFVILAILAPVALGGTPAPGDAQPKYRDVRTALEAIYLVKSEFYKPVSVSKLISAYFARGTVSGMLESLGDPYTRYMSPKDFQALRDDSAGVFGGIGILVGIRNKNITIITPIENTPGMRAGLMPGDHIVEIDGVSTEGMALDRAVSMMRGEPGTRVVLVIERGPQNQRFTVDIIRDIINSPSTRGYMLDKSTGIGYIELRTFSQKAGQEMEAEIQRLRTLGMKGLILDLRYNGGGLVSQAVEVASKFIPPGPVMHVQGRDQKKKTLETVGKRVVDFPVVVLVNEYTASASEILAGALQDNRVATVVGTPTFGKGLVQTLYPLSDGSGLAVTTQIYLTAGERAITPETPITPDHIVEMPDPEDLPEVKNETPQEPVTAEDLLRLDPERDLQLRRAIEILSREIEATESRKAA
ncbi:MAG: S41 family peptidase [Firmicutes bacterium]|jgi:carboxyl-terminal processing protease|nr:S41 family peptidase [Bacillota bacterium]